MATRNYWAVFGSGAPTTNSGLAPTFITFISPTGSAGSAPSITEPGTKGFYLFQYDASLTMISFVLDGATTGLAATDRYVYGVLDPFDSFGTTLNAIGSTLSGMGSTLAGMGATLSGTGATLSGIASLLGGTGSSFGTDVVDPTTVFGFLKRAQETNEGNEAYVKSTGVMTISSRGSSQLLATKTITDSTSQTTKT